MTTVVTARKLGQLGAVTYGSGGGGGSDKLTINVPSDINASQLNRLRRQFLNYNKMHAGAAASTGNNLNMIAQLFVQFLNSNFNK